MHVILIMDDDFCAELKGTLVSQWQYAHDYQPENLDACINDKENISTNHPPQETTDDQYGDSLSQDQLRRLQLITPSTVDHKLSL